MGLSYVALGDSLTIGVGSSLFTPGFVERYREMAAGSLAKQIRLYVFARSGYETKHLIQRLTDERLQASIKDAQIITITAGGNDFIRAKQTFNKSANETAFIESLQTTKRNISKVICSIHELKADANDSYIMRIPNLYHEISKNPLVHKWKVAFNEHLMTYHNECNIKIIDINRLFKTNQRECLTFDGLHPNDCGYEKLAIALANSGYGNIA